MSEPTDVPLEASKRAPAPVGNEKNLAMHGLRGFAAISVVLFHIYEMSVKRQLLNKAPDNWAGLALHNLGGYSVSLFFCISGFLIVQSLIKHGNVAEFARNRVARIYPAFAVLHLIMFTVGVAASYEWMATLRHDPLAYLANFFSNLLFLPGVFTLPLAQKNAWSLSYEALFYILAAVAYVAVIRRKSQPAQSALLALAFLASSVAFLVFRSRSEYFLIGVACYFLATNSAPRGFRQFPRLVGAVALVAGLAAYAFSQELAMPIVFALFWTVVTQQGWLSVALSSKPFQFLGTISYSLYLIHPFVMDPLRTLAVHLAPKIGRLPAVALFALLAVTLVPMVTRVFYDLVEVKLTRRLFGKWRARRPAVAPA